MLAVECARTINRASGNRVEKAREIERIEWHENALTLSRFNYRTDFNQNILKKKWPNRPFAEATRQ
jgi:hypothetical protein